MIVSAATLEVVVWNVGMEPSSTMVCVFRCAPMAPSNQAQPNAWLTIVPVSMVLIPVCLAFHHTSFQKGLVSMLVQWVPIKQPPVASHAPSNAFPANHTLTALSVSLTTSNTRESAMAIVPLALIVLN